MIKFRLISIFIANYKIVSKILTNRMKKVLAKCISKSQSVFIPSKTITNNIIIGV